MSEIAEGSVTDTKHGTLNAYTKHQGCRCSECRKANRAWMTRWRQGHLGTLVPGDGDPRHGLNGYRNYGCKCEICKAAGSASNAMAARARRRRRSD